MQRIYAFTVLYDWSESHNMLLVEQIRRETRHDFAENVMVRGNNMTVFLFAVVLGHSHSFLLHRVQEFQLSIMLLASIVTGYHAFGNVISTELGDGVIHLLSVTCKNCIANKIHFL